MDGLRAEAPIDAAILGAASAEIGARPEVLFKVGGASRHQGRQSLFQGLSARQGHALEHLPCRVVWSNGYHYLRHDIALVGLDGHGMQRGTGLGFPVNHCPIDGDASAVFGQQRAMQVVSPFFGDGQQGRF